jgi:hypothetical protein
MDTIAALLIIAYHLIFGCHSEDPGRAPPAAPAAVARSR